MKKIIVGIIAASILVSCVEDELIINEQNEKTKAKKTLPIEGGEFKKETDSVRSGQFTPNVGLEPGVGLDPGDGIDPGEVGPVVTTPPK